MTEKASPYLNCFLMVQITFKRMSDAATKILRFSNRPFISPTLTEDVYPLLREVSGCGMSVNQAGMPNDSTGTISIADPFNSIGEERRVFDLLQTYTPIDQDVTIYAGLTRLNDTAVDVGSYLFDEVKEIWNGKISDCQKSFSGIDQTLSFSVNSLILLETPVSREITNDITGGAIDSAIGKAVPTIFGTGVQVPAIQSSEGESPYFWYGVSRKNQFEYPSPSKFYCKDRNGIFREINSGGGSTSTYNYRSAGTGGSYPTAQGTTERAYDLTTIINDTSYIITRGRWRFKGQNNGGITPDSGIIVFTLYKLVDNSDESQPLEAIAQATVNKDDYLTQVRGASDFWVDFSFDQPVIIENDGNNPQVGSYAISMRLSTYDTSVTDFVDGGFTGTVSASVATRDDNQNWSQFSTVSETAVFELFGVTISEVKYPSGSPYHDGEGFRFYGFQISQGTAGTNQSNPDLQLEIIVETDGLNDDSGGNITGSAYGTIEYPQHVLALLSWEFDGTDWNETANTIVSDTSADNILVAGSGLQRKISGSTIGRTFLGDFAEQLLRETGCKLIQKVDTGTGDLLLYLYAWGYRDSVKKVFWDEDIKVQAWKRLDSSSIINNIKIYFDRALVNYNELAGINDSSFANYRQSLYWNKLTNELTILLSYDSYELYGDKELQIVNLDLINDSDFAEAFAKFLLSTLDHPQTFVTFESPLNFNQKVFVGGDFDTLNLQLMDIIEIVSPSLPAFYGTSPDARLPVYDGEEVEISEGKYLKRAQRYRCQIVSKALNWSYGANPTFIFEARIISPYHPNDPT